MISKKSGRDGMVKKVSPGVGVGGKSKYSLMESERYSVMSESLQPQGYIVHGILQARILELVAVSFSR